MIVPENAKTAGNIGFVVLVVALIALVQLKERWRTILLVPTVYLAACVWEARLAVEPSVTRQILVGAIIQLGKNVDVGMLILAGLFAIITAPVIAHRIGRLVYQEQRAQDGLIAKERMDRGDID